jgi:hypothetical protein
VKIKLVRISNKATTEPLDFFFLPAKKIHQFIRPSSSAVLLIPAQTSKIGAFETRANTNYENTKMFESSPSTIVDLYNDQRMPIGQIDSYLTPSVNTPICNSIPLIQSSSDNHSASDHSDIDELNIGKLNLLILIFL